MRVAAEALDRGSVWAAASLAAVEAQVQEAAQGDRVDPAGEAVELAAPRAGAVRLMPETCGAAVAQGVDLPVGVLAVARAAWVDPGALAEASAEAQAEWAGPVEVAPAASEAVEVAPVLVAEVAAGVAPREALSGLVIRANG